jgi:hypothetical protein
MRFMNYESYVDRSVFTGITVMVAGLLLCDREKEEFNIFII